VPAKAFSFVSLPLLLVIVIACNCGKKDASSSNSRELRNVVLFIMPPASEQAPLKGPSHDKMKNDIVELPHTSPAEKIQHVVEATDKECIVNHHQLMDGILYHLPCLWMLFQVVCVCVGVVYLFPDKQETQLQHHSESEEGSLSLHKILKLIYIQLPSSAELLASLIRF